MLNITITPEAVFSVDLLYLRLSLAFAYLKSIKFEAANIRKAIHDFSVQMDLIKLASERIVQAALRTHRLVRHQAAVFPGLLDSVRIFELNPRTVRGVDLLMKVNLASIMVVKTFATPLNPDKADFLLKLSKATLGRVAELRAIFAERFNETSESLLEFLGLRRLLPLPAPLHGLQGATRTSGTTWPRAPRTSASATSRTPRSPRRSRASSPPPSTPSSRAPTSSTWTRTAPSSAASHHLRQGRLRRVSSPAPPRTRTSCADLSGVVAPPVDGLVDQVAVGEDFLENYLNSKS